MKTRWCFRDLEDISQLKEGSLVRDKGNSLSYIVTEVGKDSAALVRTEELTHPQEWEVGHKIETHGSWGDLLDKEARTVDDPIIRCSIPPTELSEEFNFTDQAHSGDWFLAWGKKFVFFPRWEDGRAMVAKAPRDPEPLGF